MDNNKNVGAELDSARNKEQYRQLAIIEELRIRLSGVENKLPQSSTDVSASSLKEGANKELYYYIETFGCQMNFKDSEKFEGILQKIGYKSTDKIKEADFVLYNTCCIRENAERKVYARIGNMKKLKERKPDMIVAVCGCMMQQVHVLERLRQKYKKVVDIIFGTHNIYKLAELIKTFLETKSQVIDIWKEHKEIIEDLPTERKYKYKAAVNIMYGCDNYCAYCIVPYVRGRERSRDMNSIITEVKDLVADGVKEIMLLGQNVNSYHGTCHCEERSSLSLENKIASSKEPPRNDTEEMTNKIVGFATLLRELNKIEGLERIRFMTPHPKDFTDDVIYAIRDCDKVCKYVHLPMQSGSTNILKEMNRRYTKASYLELVNKIKKEIPNVSFTTDIIVGFPGETEEDFEDTLDVVGKVRFDGAFTFIYSKRTGTKAATMENQVEQEVVDKRFSRLLELQERIQTENNAARLGKVYKVLVEEVSKNDPNLLTGRTDQNILVHFAGDKELIGEIVDVEIIETKGHYLTGRVRMETEK